LLNLRGARVRAPLDGGGQPDWIRSASLIKYPIDIWPSHVKVSVVVFEVIVYVYAVLVRVLAGIVVVTVTTPVPLYKVVVGGLAGLFS
jgi:hypothetical protein